MKYATTQSRIEEIIIDLEDGCILRLDRLNTIEFSVDYIYKNNNWGGKINPHFSHFEVKMVLMNGLSYAYETNDKVLVESLLELTSHV